MKGNIIKQNIFKKLKVKNLIYQKRFKKEKMPIDKKSKKEEKSQSNIYNISIKNINNNQNNINILNSTDVNNNYKTLFTSPIENQLKPKLKISGKLKKMKIDNKNNNMNKSMKNNEINKIKYVLDESIEKEWKSKKYESDSYPTNNFSLNYINNFTLTLKDSAYFSIKKPLDDIEQEKEKHNIYFSNTLTLKNKEETEPIYFNSNTIDNKSHNRQRLLRNNETFHSFLKNKIVVMKIIKSKPIKIIDNNLSNSHKYNAFYNQKNNNNPNLFQKFSEYKSKYF